MGVSCTSVTLANVGRQESNVQNNEDSTRTSKLDYTTNDKFSEWHQSESVPSKAFSATHVELNEK